MIEPAQQKSSFEAMEFAITCGFDALRICLGQKPKTRSLQEIVEWMRYMEKFSD